MYPFRRITFIWLFTYHFINDWLVNYYKGFVVLINILLNKIYDIV